MDKNFVFTISAGRTGTAYLAKLLGANIQHAEAYHERLGYDRFGIDTPDVSHFTLFNSQGNVEKVKAFWAQKLGRVATTKANYYIETSHLLAKAGLLENIDILSNIGPVHIVILKREWFKTVVSYINRCDFVNKGNMWLWYLDPDYPKNLVNPVPFMKFGLNGIRVWYLCEMATRSEYYKLSFEKNPDVIFYEASLEELSNNRESISALLGKLGVNKDAAQVVIPPAQNENTNKVILHDEELSMLEKVIDGLSFDPASLARNCIARGALF